MNLCSRNEYEQNEDKSKRYAWEGLCQELAHLLDIPNVNVGKCRTENELQYFVGAEFEIKEHRSWWPVEISEIYFKNEYNPPLFGIKYIEGNYCIVKTLNGCCNKHKNGHRPLLRYFRIFHVSKGLTQLFPV